MRILALVALVALAACEQRVRETPPDIAAASPAIVENFSVNGYRGATIAINGDVVTATRAPTADPQGIRVLRLPNATTPVRVTLASSGADVEFAVMRSGNRQYPEGDPPYTVVLGPGALDDVVFFSRETAPLTVTMTDIADCGAAAEAACLGQQTAPAPAPAQ